MKEDRELNMQEDGDIDQTEFRKKGNFNSVKKEKRNDQNTSASN